MIVRPDGKILHHNTATNQLLGYEGDTLKGRRVHDLLTMSSVAELNALIADHESDDVTKKMMAQHRDGSEVLLSVQIMPWLDADENPRCTLVLRNITDEMKEKELTREDYHLANTAIKNARMGIFSYNPIKDEVTLSTIWYELMGLDPNDPVDFRAEWTSRIHPEDRAHTLQRIQPCLDGVSEESSYACRVRSKDDTTWLWMGIKVSIAERDAAGTVTRIIGVMTDITERKTVENALRKAEEQFRSAYEGAVVGMAVTDLDGTWLRVNPALCNLLGYSEEALLSTDTHSLTHPDDVPKSREQMALLQAGKIPNYQIEKRFIRSNGATMWALVSVGVVSDALGQPEQFISQVLDITEQRRLAQLKTEFVSTVSHELRTPLTSVLGALELLSFLDEEPLSDEARRLLFIALKNGKRLHSLINDVLDFEKFSSLKMRFELTHQNIPLLVEDAVLTNMVTADKFGVQFAIDCADRSVAAFVDAKRLQQVMTNLLTNAAKFADEGSIVDIAIEGLPDFVRVSISNAGPCIPKAFHDQIFRPFAQAAPSATRKRDGTGLGLNITRQIVEQTGGTIGFESTEGEKTTFWFTIPVKKPT